jgi:ankyrin repeat protein
VRGDVLSQYGYSALLLACRHGHIDVARWLVSEAGSDARSERNNVGLCDDAACGCVVVCHCGVRGDVLSQNGYSALLVACCDGHIDVARWLVSEAGSDARSERNIVSRCDTSACGCVVVCFHGGMRGDVLLQDGSTALLLTCRDGHIDVARWLVSEAGSDARSERDHVCRRDDAAYSSVDFVSECGARDDVLSQDGNSALLLASCDGHIDVAQWLVSEAGSDAPSERANVGRCDVAACVCVVVRHCGVRGDVLSQDGSSALLLACCNGHIDVARWLVSEAGSDARSERSNVRQRSCAAGLCS